MNPRCTSPSHSVDREQQVEGRSQSFEWLLFARFPTWNAVRASENSPIVFRLLPRSPDLVPSLDSHPIFVKRFVLYDSTNLIRIPKVVTK